MQEKTSLYLRMDKLVRLWKFGKHNPVKIPFYCADHDLPDCCFIGKLYQRQTPTHQQMRDPQPNQDHDDREQGPGDDFQIKQP